MVGAQGTFLFVSAAASQRGFTEIPCHRININVLNELTESTP